MCIYINNENDNFMNGEEEIRGENTSLLVNINNNLLNLGHNIWTGVRIMMHKL